MHGGTAAIIDRFYDAWSRKNAAAPREPFAADGRYADRWHVATSSASN
jgi:hypothetical protein